MAVNNYAPAEYGGYVSGVESGGGGGGVLVQYIATSEGFNVTLNCSYNDLLADITDGKIPYIVSESEGVFCGMLVTLFSDGVDYAAHFGWLNGSSLPFFSSDPDDNLVFVD